MTDRVALVTGGTSGIGAESAKAFARAGYGVVLSGRREAEGNQVASEIESAGGQALFVRADASVEDDAVRLVETTLERFGRLDAAFNNAGIEGDVHRPSHEQSHENFRRVFDINVWGVLCNMKHQIPAMLERGGGSIVNNASVAGLVGFGGMSVYSASKHAVVGLTRNAALEYATQGIRVNAVAPGPIETEMYERFADDETKAMIASIVPTQRAGKVAEIATAVVWLADPANSYTTGQTIAIDGGYTAQ